MSERKSDNEDGEIFAGNVEEEAGFSKDPKFNENEHRQKTASVLTWTLIGLFGLGIFSHTVILLVLHLHGKGEAADKMGVSFNVWFPVLSSFVGGATTYYFTKEK
jgi:hypothetical protein